MYDPTYHLFLLVVIPIILFCCSVAFYREDNEWAALIASILLVISGLPHLLAIPALLNGTSFVGITIVGYLLLLILWGIFAIIFGVRGILTTVRA